MGILEHTSNFQNCIKKTNKIPEYAREFKNEYLFIRGTNKTCERFIKILDLDAKIFNSPQAYQLKLYSGAPARAMRAWDRAPYSWNMVNRGGWQRGLEPSLHDRPS